MTNINPDTWQRLQELFASAIEREETKRAEFVEQSCGSDTELRCQLEQLLADFEPSARELERSPVGTATSIHRLSDSMFRESDHNLPKRIGQYKIKDVIASGGMGVVYEAEQENPRRTVAVKVMRLAIGSPNALQRFEHESQILARMRHPGIAQVLEAGIHQDAAGTTPFFAMEYVPGAQTISEYCDTKRLSLRRRLELFIQVCNAVAHGHQKGIIHRDLKPANLLVDEFGHLKIIDFGVARSTDNDIAPTSMLTDVGQLVGTLQYMSPEQCAADPLDIDMRSDIYALGLILYELLCRRLPYDVTYLAVGEATRVVREAPIPKLSTTDARLRGDLETIVGKALEKNRDYRYESVVHFADDVGRYLNGQAIQARPPSISYQLRMFARRHKGLVAGIAAVVVALVLGIIGTSAGLVREKAAREDAVTELYRSLVREARALRFARVSGYRKKVFDLLTRARQLNTSNLNLDELREEAVMSMGDFRGFEPTEITGFPAEVRVIDLDASGRRLAAGMAKGTLIIYDAKSGLEITRLPGHQASLLAIRFARSSDRFISVDKRGTVKVWRSSSPDHWELLQTFQVAPSIRRAVITDDGERLLALSESSVSLWSVPEEKCIGTYSSVGASLARPAISPDHRFLAAGQDDHVLIWDVAKQQIVHRLPSKLGRVDGVAFSPDSKLLACACNMGLVIWKTTDFSQFTSRQSMTLSQTLFSPSGRFLATCANIDDRTILLDVASGREIAELSHDNSQGLSINADGTVLGVLGGRNLRSVRIWDLAGADDRLNLQGETSRCTALAFNPDGKTLASGCARESTTLWDLTSQQATHHWGNVQAGAGETVAFSPDGQLLATGSWSRGVRISNADTGKELFAPDHDIGKGGGPVSTPRSVAFDQSGEYFAACGDGMALWKVGRITDDHGGIQLEMQRLIQLSGSWSLHLCFSPNSKILAWVNAGVRIRLWDIKNSREISFAGPRMMQGWDGLAFLPDGERLIYITVDGNAEVWNVVTGKKDFLLGDPGAFRRSNLSLTHDGRFLAAFGNPNTLTIWDARERKLLFSLPEDRVGIGTFAFEPNGNQLAIGLRSGEIHVWSIPKIRSQLANIGLDWTDD